jgi:hypothetical protein
MSEDRDTSGFQTTDVEARIAGEFMWRLQESDIDLRLIEIMEEQLDKDDFGGDDEITELVEEEILENED